jgi:prepilin-type N-terminal cleavage/methylation domain-containing protein
MHERIRKAKDEGFTLIELLIVIIILGILAAIVVFAVGSTRKDSVQATCQTDVKSIVLAEEAWNTKNGSYTTNQADLAGPNGTLKSWPTDGASTTDPLKITLGSGTGGYGITIAGTNLSGSVNQSDTKDGTVKTQCTGT